MSFVHRIAELVEDQGSTLTSKADHWERVPLERIARVVNGYPFASSGFNTKTGKPVIRIRDVTSGEASTMFDGDVSEAPKVEHGELVIGMDGDFNSRLWPGDTAWLNQRVCKIEPIGKYYSTSFLAYAIPAYLKLVNDNTSAITVKHLSSATVQELPLPLPPRAEQDRVASKIDELFSRIDEGEAALARVEKLVERYRQSVLKSAVTGELTREWRAARKRADEPVESGAALLTRILKARRAAWEAAELKKMKAKGKSPTDDRWKQKYQEPAPPDNTSLPELPEGWVWATLPQLGEFGRGKSKHRPRNDPKLYGGPYPFLQTGTVRSSRGRITSFDTTYNEQGLAQSKLWPKGTVCITIAANIAESGILDFDACFPDSIVGFVPSDGVVGEYIEFFVRTARDDLERYAPATAQKNINLEILEQVAIPLPPYAEQQRVLASAQEAMSKIDAVEHALGTESSRSAALRQSILKAAFSGQLVPQDPHDEPASKLLERIAAERTTAPSLRTRMKKSA